MSSKVQLSDTILFIITRLFFLLFLYSAADKLLDYQKFRVQLGQSPMLTSFAGLVAWSIPVMEIVISVLVMVPKTMLIGLYASFTLMAMFTAYIFVLMNYSEYVPCSCNGILEGASWGQHLVFNIFFIALAVTGVVLRSKIDSKHSNKTIGSGDAESLLELSRR